MHFLIFRYTLYELNLENELQQHVVQRFFGNKFVDIVSTPKTFGHPTTVVVYPEAQAQFLDILKQKNIPFSVLIEDVERYTILLPYRNKFILNSF